MKKVTKLFIGVALLAVLMMAMTATSFAGTANDKAKIYFSSAMPGQFDMVGYELNVTGDLFEKYFPDMAADDAASGVSFADAIVAAHVEKYGADKVTENLDFGAKDWISKHFGHSTVGMYYVNDKSLQKGVNTDTVKDGDMLFAYTFDNSKWSGFYAYFDKFDQKATVGEEVELKLSADDWGTAVVPSEAKLCEINLVNGKLEEVKGATYENGTFKVKFDKADVYVLSATGKATGSFGEGPIAGPIQVVEVKDKKPAKPVIKSAKRTTKKKAVVTWKKAKNAKRYQVAYKAKGAKKWTTKNTKKTKITLKLKANKKYQVKVRSINGMENSKYSKVKTIKIKK